MRSQTTPAWIGQLYLVHDLDCVECIDVCNMVEISRHLTQLYISLHNENVSALNYVGTVNGPTSITRLGVWKMYQKVASFSFLDPPPQNRH